MYNFNLMKDEEIIEFFEKVWIRQGDNEKDTTIVLTNKRLLFLDYIHNDGAEVLRITRGIDYVRYKEVYYYVDLNDIKSIEKKECYLITLKDKTFFEFEDVKLYKLLLK